MKKIIKTTIILLIAISINICSLAAVTGTVSDFEADFSINSVDKVSDTLAGALEVIQIIGFAVAAVMIIALAIKYMVSSVSERAEIKKHAIVYLVGASIMFASSGLVGIIRAFAGSLD